MQAFGENQMRQLGRFGYNQCVKNQAVKNIQVNGLQTNHNLKRFGTNQLKLIDSKLEHNPLRVKSRSRLEYLAKQ